MIMMLLGIQVWKEHIELFNEFDLVCTNGSNLDDETKYLSLFSALSTLERMLTVCDCKYKKAEIHGAIKYLKNTKYY